MVGFWTKILIGVVIILGFLILLFAYKTNFTINTNDLAINTNENTIATQATIFTLHNLIWFIIPIALISTIILLLYWVWGLRSKDKSYKLFEDKNIVPMSKAQELISKKFADFGCPVITEETGFWMWKKESHVTQGIEFLSQRFASFKNQPVGYFEVNVTEGQHMGKIFMIQAPLAKGEKTIYPDWNVQMTDENRFGYKLEKNNFPILAPISQAERTLDELYRISDGDPEKMAEVKEILDMSKEMPQSLTPTSEAVPDSFAQNWGNTNKKTQPNRYGRYNYPPVALSEEGEE